CDRCPPSDWLSWSRTRQYRTTQLRSSPHLVVLHSYPQLPSSFHKNSHSSSTGPLPKSSAPPLPAFRREPPSLMGHLLQYLILLRRCSYPSEHDQIH
ncbi:hypothetical protein GIB67_013971, partial [Kingdonia uniflora]